MNPKLTLLTLCALSVSALNVLAEHAVITSSTTETDKVYGNDGGNVPLYITGSGVVYSGTRLTVTSTYDTGIRVQGQSAAILSDVTVTSSGPRDYTYGIVVQGTAALTADNLQVSTVTDYYGDAVIMAQSSTVNISNFAITTQGDSSRGIYLVNADCIADVTGGTISTSGFQSFGLAISATNGQLVATNVTIFTSGSAASGATLDKGYMELNNVTVNCTGLLDDAVNPTGAAAAGRDGQLVINNSQINSNANGLYGENGGTIVVNNSLVASTGTGAAIFVQGAADIAVTGGTLATDGGNLVKIDNKIGGFSGDVKVVLDGVAVADAGGIITGVGADFADTATVTVIGGSGLYGDVLSRGDGALHLYLEHTGLTGEVLGSGASTTAVNLHDSTLNGGATAKDHAVIVITGSTGSAISGDVMGSDRAVIEVTLSGSHSVFLGDIAQHDEAVVTVTVSDGATGRGGFASGNLITGSDSTWTFDQDSHGTNGENHGTWNIGDYDVTFDNLDHSGTINISVNSDTGEGGSITVTGTVDGEGTIHIDTTGNGKADPNQVLPGKVTGEGTEHWQWDPIDWGIDTIIKDGDHFIKQGTSPAGAVLNSSVAIQQAMWFAQQNSLLKRMGELRYGARASRPLADKDVRVPYNSLIENIWLRSYGQQLNIGSQVAGKAYEQLIYGVDLGTDHKFTISADSDLYLGVYAGYGRSDIDYRTPGANGEINSYYGGLYATWLHSSGFYIDATVKAASVDNNLKAPHGDTQLKANYSDINLGGSLELGKKFTFADAWFIEPQFQVNYLHILAEDYTAGHMNLKAQDLDALQLRIGSIFGRTINLTNSGVLQPYVKISGVETISSGGTIRNGYQHTRANTDGARAELGGGLIWQLDADNQLHLDYEASFGDKYDKPWGLTAGYRHQF